jgi:hypothetical protein
MTEPPVLRIEVRDDEIIVTLPDTDYRVVYHKPAREPQLIAKSRSDREHQEARITQAEFHARAWKAANDKARELGWIV